MSGGGRPRRTPRLRRSGTSPWRTLPWRTFLAVFLAVFVISGAGGTASAFWTVPAVTMGGTATAATAAVTVSGTATLQKQYRFTAATASTANLQIAPVVFANTGSSPLTLTAAWTANTGTLATAIAVTYWVASTPGTCAASIPSTGTTAGTLAVPPALPAGVTTVAIGSSVTLCVATVLTGATAMVTFQGQTVSPVLTLTGRVGTNWSTGGVTAPAFTQSVFKVAAAGPFTCVNTAGVAGLGGYATVSWPAVSYPAATTGTVNAASYDLRKGSLVTDPIFHTVTPAAGATTVSVKLDAATMGILGFIGSGTIPIVVTTNDTVYGTTSVASASLGMRYALLPLLTVQCPL